MQVQAQMQIVQSLGDAAEEGAGSALGLLEPLGEPGSVVASPEVLGMVSEALQSTFARIVAPVRAILDAMSRFIPPHTGHRGGICRPHQIKLQHKLRCKSQPLYPT